MLKVNEAELPFLRRILSDPASVDERSVYADWLEEQGDSRGGFLRAFIDTMDVMEHDSFPRSDGFDPAWLDLIGFTMMQKLASLKEPLKYRDSVLRLAEAAIRMDTDRQADADIEIGASKYGGEPDLPIGVSWPQGRQCDAIYNNGTEGIQELAGFLMQLELSEAQNSPFIDLPLPKSGLLSFFCYQDEDDVDCIGVNVFHYPASADLQRYSPPTELTPENELHEPRRLRLRETLRVNPGVQTGDDTLDEIIWELRCELIGNQTLFGVNDYQTDEIHFIGIDKDDATTVFVDVSEDISKVDLSWVEFDGDSGFK